MAGGWLSAPLLLTLLVLLWRDGHREGHQVCPVEFVKVAKETAEVAQADSPSLPFLNFLGTSRTL